MSAEPTTPAEHGFGQLWRKTYTIRFEPSGPDPEAALAYWRDHVSDCWPSGTEIKPRRFRGPRRLLLRLALPIGGSIDTELSVRGINQHAFSFVAGEGHMFAGQTTCSTGHDGDATYARVESVFRTRDPLYDAGFVLGGSRHEDWFWETTLKNLARRLRAKGTVTADREKLDGHRHWRNATNVRENAAIASLVRSVTSHLPGRRSEARSKA